MAEYRLIFEEGGWASGGGAAPLSPFSQLHGWPVGDLLLCHTVSPGLCTSLPRVGWGSPAALPIAFLVGPWGLCTGTLFAGRAGTGSERLHRKLRFGDRQDVGVSPGPVTQLPCDLGQAGLPSGALVSNTEKCGKLSCLTEYCDS